MDAIVSSVALAIIYLVVFAVIFIVARMLI